MSHALKNNAAEWQPSATIESLKQRAKIIAKIRRFFAQQKVWEVNTPLLCHSTVTAPYLHSLSLTYQKKIRYLQTSPEYAMKRLLAAGSGAIYQISKAFRAEESGRLHQPEFTMLEWYRPHFNHHQLMDEMDALLQFVLNGLPAQRASYAEIFQQYLNINPHTITVSELITLAQQQQINITANDLTKDDWLQLLLNQCIEPHLGFKAPLFIYDYPASQAALAKIRHDTIPVAERFEVYIQGIELANGYHELTDVAEQRQRFIAELHQRAQQQLPTVPIDEYLLAALPHMPPCAGVALGIDRLMMIALNKSDLKEIIAFTSENC